MAALSLFASAEAKERGFAIITDQKTYQACKAEIDAYQSVLLGEGLNAYVAARTWNTPQEVREELLARYQGAGLEGAVFIGVVPIAMIRDAQHFTSAFKMDQERYPFFDSSVPSDRYYDDFDLRFDYISHDTTQTLFHYYSLCGDSPQEINCDIYTGRIKPTREGEEGYRQIRDYFRKLLAERSAGNRLDVIVSYTGEGSFSNSLTTWKEEAITLREQFPQAFGTGTSFKSLFYDMYPYMKETVAAELRRDEVDLMMFHEHGTFDRQYMTGIPLSKGTGEYAEAAKRLFRNRLRREAENKGDTLKLKQDWLAYYPIKENWFSGAFDPEQMKKDSLDDIARGIVLDDVPGLAPNPRIVIFDACYNGDFREERFIAGEYIFAKGKTLVAIGNSVNVLQDKSSSDLLGLLGLGYRVGEWAQLTHILESHILGDPTFFFQPPENHRKMDLSRKSPAYWLKALRKADHPDEKGTALYKLYSLHYPGLPRILEEIYRSSRSAMLRLQVFHLLQHYNDERFGEMLKQSVYDPYEFIRRKSVHAMGRSGSDEYIPYVASIWLNDYLDERVRFNAEFCFDVMDGVKLEREMMAQIDRNESLSDKEETMRAFTEKLESRKRIAEMSMEIADTTRKLSSRLLGVSTLRNSNYHTRVGYYLEVLRDPVQPLSLRIKLAEALGWFTLSHRKGEIVAACRQLAETPDIDQKLKNELVKTARRLEVFMR